MKQFEQKVDLRNRSAMISYLENHFWYDTSNSWNRSTSYANNVKIDMLGLPYEVEMKLFDMIEVDGFYDGINDLIAEFVHNHGYVWQAGFNGRSGGYLVLYRGGSKQSEYKSFCSE